MTTIKIPVHELTGAALDWAVALCEVAAGHYTLHPQNYSLPLIPGPCGSDGAFVFGKGDGHWREPMKSGESAWQSRGPAIGRFEPSTDGRWATEIMQRENIGAGPGQATADSTAITWSAWAMNGLGQSGPTMLIAAMRCYVYACHAGAYSVEVPQELAS